MQTTNEDIERILVSRRKASELIDCSLSHIDDLIERGELTRVAMGARRVGITYASLKTLVSGWN
jgi:hypothetical protein